LIYATIFIYVVLLIVDYRFFVIIAMFLYLVGIVTYSYRWLIDISSLNIIADRFECVFYSIVRAAPLMIVGVMSSQMNRRIDVKHDAIIVIILFALLLIESFIVKSNYDNKYSYVVLTLPLCFYTFNLISG
jgi:peptidoglycan/LPS O-acetylase OafA/YrhL